MGSDLPKVLHPVAGRPMLRWVVDACLGAGVERCVVVVGYRGDDVRAALADEPRCVSSSSRPSNWAPPTRPTWPARSSKTCPPATCSCSPATAR